MNKNGKSNFLEKYFKMPANFKILPAKGEVLFIKCELPLAAMLLDLY